MATLRIQKPQDVKRMLVQVTNEVRASDMELEKKARVLAYLGTVILTSMKDGDLEERITQLEQQAKGR